jgi:hypothetical protein
LSLGLSEYAEEIEVIAIGNDFGGPELRGSKIHKALNLAMNVAASQREPNFDNGVEAWINPIFIVPGSVSQTGFDGFELGHFSRRKKGLVVKIAVPQAVANGDGISDFIGGSLREAVRIAAAEFASKGINFSSLKAEKIISAIEEAL